MNSQARSFLQLKDRFKSGGVDAVGMGVVSFKCTIQFKSIRGLAIVDLCCHTCG